MRNFVKPLLLLLLVPACGTDNPGTEAGTGGTGNGSQSTGGSTGGGALAPGGSGGAAGDGGSSTGGTGNASGSGGTAGAPPVDPSAPDWMGRMAVGTWVAISGSSPDLGLSPTNVADDIDPNVGGGYDGNTGFQALMSAWNGGAYAPGLGLSGSLLCFGGGHGDYHGNEVIRFDVATRTWSLLTQPYSVGSYAPPYTNGLFPDGSPNPPHTYNQAEHDPISNSFMIGRTQINDNPSSAHMVAMLDLDTLAWRHAPVNSEPHGITGGWSAYDSARSVWWLEGGGTGTALAKFDPSTDNGNGSYGTYENHASIIGGGLGNGAAYSPTLDKVVIVTAFGEVHAFDPEDPGDGVELDATNIPNTPNYASLVWSPRRDAFLYYPGDTSSVYELALTSGDWDTGTWTFTNLEVNPGSGPDTSRVLSKFRLARFGNDEVLVMADIVTSPVYAFRVP